MGSRMAERLQGAGFDLVVHNRTREKAEPLLANGAVWADGSAGVGRAAEVVFTMLADPESVRETALAGDGLLSGLRPGNLWVDCTTVNPSFSREMGQAAHERGVRFMDAPVAGSKQPAAEGQLLFLAGGDEADVEACRPYFDAMGRDVVHAGGIGTGTSMKMLFNMMLGINMAAFAEMLALGASMGIARESVLDALIGSAVAAPFVQGKRSRIEQDEYGTEFPLKWMHKDLHLAAVTAYETGVAMPVENAAKEAFALAERLGLSEEDFSAVVRAYVRKPGD